jgi:hypothetical protein
MATGIAGEDIFTITQGIRVHRPTATTAADQDLFSIDGGNVLLLGFLGEVTTAIGAGSQDFEIDHDPDDGGSNVALSTLLLVDGDVTGTLYTLNPTNGGALVATTDVAYNVMLADPIALTPGDIVLDVTGTEAGSVEWWVWYVPIDVGASITAS